MFTPDKLSDEIQTTGIILCTENYDACVNFYHRALGLPIWFEKSGLTCLRYGASYLMIEHEGFAWDKKTKRQNPTTLRFNVKDIDKAQKVART